MLRVLVTRPEPGASRTAARLQGLGFEPVLLPLTETRPLPATADAVPKDAVAVAVTSANAIRHAPKVLIEALAGLPCFAVGGRTADAARAAGFSTVSEGPGDAAALADQIAGSLAYARIVYLCGRVRLAGFEQKLRLAGVDVHAIESYDTVALHHSSAMVAARLSGRPVDAVLLYSANAAIAARALMKRADLHHLLEKAGFFALSRRVSAPLDAVQPGKVHVASAPNEDALLALLKALD